MRLDQNRVRELLLLIGLCGFFFFFRLSGIGLLGPDEPRYAQVAREMLDGHNWVTPMLYGHPWLEKPILLYWGEMLSYRAFGSRTGPRACPRRWPLACWCSERFLRCGASDLRRGSTPP